LPFSLTPPLLLPSSALPPYPFRRRRELES
jgi:hypothetical protein